MDVRRRLIPMLLAGAATLASAAYLLVNVIGAPGTAANAAAAGEGDDAARRGPPALVELARAETRTFAPLAETPGSVVSMRDSLIAAETNGRIVWIADVGDEIEEGGVIARIDKDNAQLRHDDQAAEVARLRSRSSYLDRNFERFAEAGDELGESDASLDEMRANRDEARNALARAVVALKQAALDLERTDVRAPFGGRIVTREIEIGEFANPGAAIVRLVDANNVEVTARAPASLARNVAPGAKVEVRNGAETVDAAVRAVVPVGDELSRMLELRLELPDVGWYIGSPVRAMMPTDAPRKAIAAPRDALILRASGVSVFVVDAGNVARRVTVETGVADGDFIEIIGDLKPGQNVVVRGGERLRDGQAVTTSDEEDLSS
ncbi:MAG: efflux RND transporter periplasmic adaptor subunit [Parvularculaceae bacterium]